MKLMGHSTLGSMTHDRNKADQSRISDFTLYISDAYKEEDAKPNTTNLS